MGSVTNKASDHMYLHLEKVKFEVYAMVIVKCVNIILCGFISIFEIKLLHK